MAEGSTPVRADPQAMQREMMKNLALRLGLPIGGVWLFAAWMNKGWMYAIAAVVTVAAGGLMAWGWNRVSKTRKVADILQSVDATSKEGRQEALAKLAEAGLDKGDVGGRMAKAQLTMQDDPDAAMAELEAIDLAKILPAEADQVRFQRAMIHLHRGEVDQARALVDPIDLKRHQEAKSRAMMAVVIAEAWARTGQAKKGMELLDLYKADDPELAEIRPQLWRARAFAAASLNDMKAMKHALRTLANDNPQYLGMFMQKKIHPMLMQEAKIILMKSGAVPTQKPRVRYR